MKKLVIAVCAMALGVIANAASIEWWQTDSLIYTTKGSLVADGTSVYLIDATFADTSFVSAWASGGIDAALDAAGEKVVDVNGYMYEGMAVADDPASYGNRNISAYYALVNGDELFISHTQAAVLSPLGETNSTIEFTGDPVCSGSPVTLASEYAGGAAWVQNVPEPTSGLLLLLGVAGLALRRRRA